MKTITLTLAIFVIAFTTPLHATQPSSILLVDAQNGHVLFDKDSSEKRYPASLTKLMTLYIAFSQIKHGKMKWNQMLSVSENAEKQVPSKLGLKSGEKITVRNAIMSLIVKSANDSAVVVAENIGNGKKRGEKHFITLMNETAKKLGMQSTYFINPSGLHNEKQTSSAVDLALLSLALKNDFPNYYKLFSQTSFNYNGQTIDGFNHITKNYPGAEGMKTGYTKASGYNLLSTVKRDDIELIGVILGVKTAKTRNRIMEKLLDMGIKKLGSNEILLANKPNTIFSN